MTDVRTRTHAQSFPSGMIELLWASVTDQGKHRSANQDALLAEYPLFIVADGMGGHLGGEIASARTITRLNDVVTAGEVTTEKIEKALAYAVIDIAEHPEATDEATGTTVTGMFLSSQAETAHWVTLNIGDSRVYVLRDNALVQVTTDHSIVQELVSSGRITPDEVDNHPYGNVITRAVGPDDSVVPDYVRIDLVDGDRFVICSDGLTKEVTDYGIGHFLQENSDPAEAVNALCAAALDNGGRDNVSIIVVNVSWKPRD